MPGNEIFVEKPMSSGNSIVSLQGSSDETLFLLMQHF